MYLAPQAADPYAILRACPARGWRSTCEDEVVLRGRPSPTRTAAPLAA